MTGVPFSEQVAAVSPLNSKAIDGSARPKPMRPRKPRRERMDASHTFFCRNANCDHATWSAVEQARHMHAEFVWAMEALVARAPESPEALLLTGDVILAELTDDECRAANGEYQRLQRMRRAGGALEIAAELKLRVGEHWRRANCGILSPAPPKETCPNGHPYSGDNLILDNGYRACLQCRRESRRKYSRKNSEKRAQKRRSDPAYRELLRDRDRKYYARKKAEREATGGTTHALGPAPRSE